MGNHSKGKEHCYRSGHPTPKLPSSELESMGSNSRPLTATPPRTSSCFFLLKALILGSVDSFPGTAGLSKEGEGLGH